MGWNEDEIKNQVKEIIKYSQNFDREPKVNKLFEDWKKNKKHFIKDIGDKLIYEYPHEVTFEMNEKDKIRNIEDFITDVEYNYYKNPNLTNLLEFLEHCKKAFFQNIVPEDITFQIDKEDIIIPKGMKINKALKYFFKDRKDDLTEIQNEVSRIIQKDKVSGILCLSVHPLDFLSVSETTYKWRSCHALDGEFRMGGLSYMVDGSSVVCYLRSTNNEQQLPHFPTNVKWNSKKWRVMIHFSKDEKMIMAGRQYPFSSEEGLNLILNKLLPSSGIYGKWTEWDNSKINSFKHNNGKISNLFDDYIVIGGELLPIRKVVKDAKNSLHFNDLLQSNYYSPYYSYRVNDFSFSSHLPYKETNPKTTTFLIGGEVKCFYCEEEPITLHGVMRCIPCEEKYGTEENEYFTFCDDCGARIYEGNIYHIRDAEYDSIIVCEDCAKKYNRCEQCGVYMTEEETHIGKNGKKYCSYCLSRSY